MNQFNMSPILPVQARFVASKQEAFMVPAPTLGCLFCFDQNQMELYVKYADGREMEEYELVKKEPPAPPKYLTEEEVGSMLDKKFEELKQALLPKSETGEDTRNYIPKKKYYKKERNYDA